MSRISLNLPNLIELSPGCTLHSQANHGTKVTNSRSLTFLCAWASSAVGSSLLFLVGLCARSLRNLAYNLLKTMLLRSKSTGFSGVSHVQVQKLYDLQNPFPSLNSKPLGLACV